MLLALLYHKIGNGEYANPIKTLEAHFQWIASHYPTLFPGEALPKKLSVCLTFDDAFFDFYHYVFPLLRKYNLKALLAVPTAYIPDKTDLSPKERLEKIEVFPDKAPPIPSPTFCTWDELKELAASPYVQIASHSLHHRPMTSSHINPENELAASKTILEEKLRISVTSFVYPFGLWNKRVHSIAKRHYKYIFRIGNAHNISWTNTNHLLYRINADQLSNISYPFTPFLRLKHSTRYLLNTFRSC